ncbi:MAG: hypothetical protein H0X41_02260 [Chitinophagaceae bacterium]|nr:hypothetical protein [Chitinophagaceae bacterium]
MIRFNEIKPGDIVMAEYEGQKRQGIVKDIAYEEKEICVETDVQEFWYSPEHLYAIPLSDEQLIHLGFARQDDGTGVKYGKDSFRLHIPAANDFSRVEIWWREDRRELNHPISVHELQNHYYQMTKVELNK